MFEKVGIGMAKTGDTYVATFRQNMDMQGGEYLLSAAPVMSAESSARTTDYMMWSV